MPIHEPAPIDYRDPDLYRARNVRLQLSAREGLVVVAPLHFDLGRIPAIVEKRRAWIEAHFRRYAELPPAVPAGPAVELPETLDLPALGELWHVEYHPTRTRVIGVLSDQPGRLVVYGAVEDRDACRESLRRWLHCRTREEIVPWLNRLAREGGFRFNETIIRGQKTRWASCSAKGTISLSFKLLFLERDWVRCVLLHELCHTVIMNHSPRFWALLAGFVPDCRAIRRGMRDGRRRVPAWVEG